MKIFLTILLGFLLSFSLHADESNEKKDIIFKKIKYQDENEFQKKILIIKNLSEIPQIEYIRPEKSNNIEGFTVIDIGEIKEITVPYKLPSGLNPSPQITKEQIWDILTKYEFVKFEEHNIPLGIVLTIYFKDKRKLLINVYGTTPFRSFLFIEENKAMRFGMEKIKDLTNQSTEPDFTPKNGAKSVR